MDRFDENKIKTACSFIKDVRIFESVDSTNAVAKRAAADGAEEGTLIISYKQTAGHGSNGRKWFTGEGQIALSMILKPEFKKENLPLITLITGLSVNEAIENVCGLRTKIKYPNDILAGDRKLCGILAEGVMIDHPYVIIGIGLNLETTSFPEDIRDIATSVSLEGGNADKAEELIIDIFTIFEGYYNKLV